jgi:hypothetical protein
MRRIRPAAIAMTMSHSVSRYRVAASRHSDQRTRSQLASV